jgi:hypothetical protein
MVALVLLVLAADPTWTPEGSRDAIALSSREIPGSKFLEFRAQTEVAGEVDALCDAVFDWASLKKNSAEVKTRTLLENEGDARVVHDDLEAPIVAHRTVTFQIKRRRLPDGTCALDAHVHNEMAPKTPEGWVRIDKMDTSWRFERSGEKIRVTFTLFVDPAGSVPPFIVRGAQKNAAADTLKNALSAVSR